MKRRATIAAGTFASRTGAWLDVSRRRKRPSPCGPCCRWSLSRAARTASVAVGAVEPQYKTNLAFRVLGRLIARPVSVGDLVSRRTDGRRDRPHGPRARGTRRPELSLRRPRRSLRPRTATEERKRTLITTDATTKQTLDNAEQARAGAEASVAHAQANLTKAIEQLGYAQVKADFAGVVTAVGAEVGQVVSPGQNVVTVARPDIREAVVDIGADFPVPLDIGLPFTVSLQLLPAVQVEGQIREIAPQADPVTRLRRVRIALNDPPESFRLGHDRHGKAQQRPKLRHLRVPASAVLAKDGARLSSGSSIIPRARFRCTRSISPRTPQASASPAGSPPARAS